MLSTFDGDAMLPGTIDDHGTSMSSPSRSAQSRSDSAALKFCRTGWASASAQKLLRFNGEIWNIGRDMAVAVVGWAMTVLPKCHVGEESSNSEHFCSSFRGNGSEKNGRGTSVRGRATRVAWKTIAGAQLQAIFSRSSRSKYR